MTDYTLIELVSAVPDYFKLVLGQQPIADAAAVRLVQDGVALLLEDLVDLGDVPADIGVLVVERVQELFEGLVEHALLLGAVVVLEGGDVHAGEVEGGDFELAFAAI